MQRINYKETIELNNTINELLVINIDDKINQTKEKDCIKISGEIQISGEVSSDNGNETFYHPLMLDIILSEEQLITDKITIVVEDFNYMIQNNTIAIDLIIKIEGLKEIEPYFPPQEDQKVIQIESKQTYDEEPVQEVEISNDIIEFDAIDTVEEKVANQDYEETRVLDKDINSNSEQHSLLNQIFKNRVIKKETSYIYHVVRKETTYAQIAQQYNVKEELIKQANKDEEIYEGKLIFIPKS